MATQVYVTEMQAMAPNVQAPTGGTSTSQQSQTQTSSSGQPGQVPAPQNNQSQAGQKQPPVTSSSQPVTTQQTTIVQTSQPNAQSQQFITVTGSRSSTCLQTVASANNLSGLVSEADNPSQDTVTLQNASQTVYPTHVQYVEGTTDHAIYASANGQMTAYPVYSVSDGTATMYTPASATYYNTSNSVAPTQLGEFEDVITGNGGLRDTSFYSSTKRTSEVSTGISHATVGLQGQILTHQTSNTYLVQGGTMDGEGHPLTHTTRASPATSGYIDLDSASTGIQFANEVQWLIDNYETAEGVSLPRSTLYNHYLRHCAEHKLDPVNAASFGKLIRSVFLGLRTRRLGTRGNSKYHYYGIRVKPTSPLNQLTDESSTMAMRQQPMNQGKRFKPASTKVELNDSVQTQQGQPATPATDTVAQQQQQHQQYLGDASDALPNFGDIDFTLCQLPEGITVNEVSIFQTLYREHCEAFLDAVVNLQFTMVESLWQTFWRNKPPSAGEPSPEKQLPKNCLYALCKCEPVQKFVRKADHEFYQNLVEVLIPDVLRPIPSSLTQAIRNFAKSLESWLIAAMTGCPEEMMTVKVNAVNAFAQTLRRYTSLNHLAQAARAVLQNTSQINQMLNDLNRVDFHNVQEQASWVCQCEESLVSKLEQDFKLTLQQQNSLEQWAAWLEGVVSQVLKPHEGKPDFAKAARQFLLKWSFYSSMVIRDLTLRSAASFGSFHLIRLLYDEYMFYLIEHRVALATGETPIAVMGEFIGMGHKLPALKAASAGGVVTLTPGGTTIPSTLGGVVASGSLQSNQANKVVLVAPNMVVTGAGDASQIAKRLKTN